MKVKVCGIKEPDNMVSVTSLDVDYIGWIFYPGSPRCASGNVEHLSSHNRKGKTVVGVFVNQAEDDILRKVDRYQLDMVQLHGYESNHLCRSLGNHVEVIKTVHIGSASDLDKCHAYPDANYLLLETRNRGWGGSGRQFDWDLLDGYGAVQPFFLSGGIGPDDVERIVDLRLSQMIGIDINSRFEDRPGIKNIPQLAHFITTLKNGVHASNH